MEERKCSVRGCSSPVLCRELCSRHYQRWRKNERPQTRPCSAQGCSRPVASRGLCDLHYRRAKRAGMADDLPYAKMPRHMVEERFWAKVEKARKCWLWTGAHSPVGYGQFWVGPGRKWMPAHRFAYEYFVAPIPAGLEVDHLCRNPPCVNPAHLEVVTSRENVLRSDGVAAKNGAKTHCINGHEFTPENTRVYLFRGGWHRACRECQRLRGIRNRAMTRERRVPEQVG